MALNRIWVYAEAAGDKISPLTLELLAKARSLAGTVEAVYAGGNADALAGVLGAHGATKVLSTGDLGGSLPGVPVASAIAKAIADGNGPDLLMLGTSYDGARHRRPPVGGRRQAGHHQQRRHRGQRRRRHLSPSRCSVARSS